MILDIVIIAFFTITKCEIYHKKGMSTFGSNDSHLKGTARKNQVTILHCMIELHIRTHYG